jgi:glutamate synthase (NADPH/NADH) large chain
MTGGVSSCSVRPGATSQPACRAASPMCSTRTGDFASRCNLAMVELEPVPEEDDLLEKLHHHGGDLEHKGRVDLSSDMTRFDEERLFQLITNHARYTGSTRAQDDPRRLGRPSVPMFVKVMPVEYRRALKEMEEAAEEADCLWRHGAWSTRMTLAGGSQ